MKRWLFLIALLPQCTGCLGYVYPTVAYTPELVVPNQDGSVHAFRVDIDKTERKEPAMPSPITNRTGPNHYYASTTEYTLTPIKLDMRGVVPSQLEIAPVTGVYNPLGLGDFKEREHSNYTLFIRAYRPGYHTIEVKAWEKSRELQWVVATDLGFQENAVDDLLADPAAPTKQMMGVSATLPPAEFYRLATTTWWELKDQKSPPLGLQPGLVSASQRQTLLFAASEYERLARSPAASTQNMQATRERLQQKATWLRSYAERGPLP